MAASVDFVFLAFGEDAAHARQQREEVVLVSIAHGRFPGRREALHRRKRRTRLIVAGSTMPRSTPKTRDGSTL